MAGAVPCMPGDISLGGDQTTRTQGAVMSEWLDDDEAISAPPPSTKVPPRDACVEVQQKGGEGVPEQQARGVPERQAEERLMVETMRSPPQGMQVDPRATPRGSRRQRQFKKVYRQADT